MSSISYDTINSLEEISFIAGTDFTIEFDVYDDAGALQDISSATSTWKLAPYGQPEYSVLSKSCSNVSTTRVKVVLLSADTATFSGKYSHQLKVSFGGGTNIVYPAQGVITIIPRII